LSHAIGRRFAIWYSAACQSGANGPIPRPCVIAVRHPPPDEKIFLPPTTGFHAFAPRMTCDFRFRAARGFSAPTA